jgi:hypothetical protein
MFQKMIADHAGHYTRPDVFDFRVNRRPKRIASLETDQGAIEAVRAGISDGTIRHADDLRGVLEDLKIATDLARGG